MVSYSSWQREGCKTEYPGVAKFGIALEWGSRGRWFESSHSDHRSILRDAPVFLSAPLLSHLVSGSGRVPLYCPWSMISQYMIFYSTCHTFFRPLSRIADSHPNRQNTQAPYRRKRQGAYLFNQSKTSTLSSSPMASLVYVMVSPS